MWLLGVGSVSGRCERGAVFGGNFEYRPFSCDEDGKDQQASKKSMDREGRQALMVLKDCGGRQSIPLEHGREESSTALEYPGLLR